MKKLLFIISFIGITSLSAIAQNNGDYRSAASGLWGSASTWERFTGGNWSAAAAKPGASSNVTVRSGHVVTLDAGANISNLTIEKGAQVNSNAIFPNSFFIRVGAAGQAGAAANTGMIKNDGILGSVADSTFTITLEMPLQCANFKITGSGTTQIIRMRPLPGNINPLNVEIDQNITFVHNNVALSAYINYANSLPEENVTFTINKDKVVKFANPSASFHLGSNKTPNQGGNYTYNIAGTLDLSACTKTSFLVPLTANANSTTTLNVSGLLKLGTGFSVDNPEATEQSGKLALNILDGGVVDASSLKLKSTLPATKFKIAPTGTFKSK
jgi:hypothetical protein